MPFEVHVKTILNKTKRRDPWFLDEYTINPYSGCSFNCLYCYIRGSKYGIHMEENVAVKANAVTLLENQLRLRSSKKQYGIIVLSSATDPYLHFEKEYEMTRKLLEVILHYRFPVHIITKSDLVLRDFDLLYNINQEAILPDDLKDKLPNKVFVTFSFSTLDDDIGKIFEPGATSPSARLSAHKSALDAGFHSGISLMPLLPFITDTGENLEYMFTTFRDVDTKYIFPATLTLFGNENADSKTLVLWAIEKHYPHLLKKYQKFFTESNQMPTYYREAFHKKAMGLCAKYKIKNSII